MAKRSCLQIPLDRICTCGTRFCLRFRAISGPSLRHARTRQEQRRPGAVHIEQLARDVLLLMDSLGVERVNFCGLSLGGMVALWLGIHAPERVAATGSCEHGERASGRGDVGERIATVQNTGMSALAGATLERWFTAGYRAQHPEEMEQIPRDDCGDGSSWIRGVLAVLRDTDLRARNSGIQVPCLVITGTHDPATPPS